MFLIQIWIILASLALLVALGRAGHFGARAFTGLAARRGDLTILDLGLGLCLYVLGRGLAAPVIGAMTGRWFQPAPVFDELPASEQVAAACGFGAEIGALVGTELPPNLALVGLVGCVVSLMPSTAWFIFRSTPAGQGIGQSPLWKRPRVRLTTRGDYVAAPHPGLRRNLRRTGLLPRALGSELQWSLLGFGIGVGTVWLLSFLGIATALLLGQEVPEIAHTSLRNLVERPDLVTWLATVATAVIAAPIFEEILFRGLLQSTLVNTFGPRHRWAILGLSAIVFGIVHLGAVPLHTLPALAGLGLVLGYLYEKTGSLWPSILVHAGFNGLNLLLVTLV